MKVEAWQPVEDKAKYKLVRTDDYRDVPGEIISADEENGECSINVAGENKTLNFGPNGIKIVIRGR